MNKCKVFMSNFDYLFHKRAYLKFQRSRMFNVVVDSDSEILSDTKIKHIKNNTIDLTLKQNIKDQN